jgi:hypothetical protein
LQPLANPLAGWAGHIIAVRDSEKGVETLSRRQELGLVSQVPLANDGCSIATPLQDFGNGNLVWMQAIRRNRAQHLSVARILMHPHPLGVTACNQTGSRRSTNPSGVTKMRELPALSGHTIQVGSAMQLGSERFNVTVAKVVAENDYEVWRGAVGRC